MGENTYFTIYYANIALCILSWLLTGWVNLRVEIVLNCFEENAYKYFSNNFIYFEMSPVIDETTLQLLVLK